MDANMEEKPLDIEILKDAVNALGNAIDEYSESLPDATVRRRDVLRSGVIQNFEVAYELYWKFMKKWLEINVEPNIIMGNTRRDFYRIAWENGLISDVKAWWAFHEARNRTLHTYSAMTAEYIFNKAIEFLPAAKKYTVDLENRI
jgi:nucleotidyltransferase substrate binding protein (TIGR01987 family)